MYTHFLRFEADLCLRFGSPLTLRVNMTFAVEHLLYNNIQSTYKLKLYIASHFAFVLSLSRGHRLKRLVVHHRQLS